MGHGYAPHVAPDPSPIVRVENGRCEARWPHEAPGSGVAVDFGSIALGRGATALLSMPLVRACGRSLAQRGATLVDATAGLGYDAYLLSRAGFRVTAIERSAEVAALLADGLRRAGQPFTLVVGDARALLGGQGAGQRPDVIYLDPMYPPKRRASALPPKEMQIVRSLVGDDADSRELFEAACAAAPRVVVKRPLHADPFAAPTSTVAGKLARFDVYVRGAARPGARTSP